jgi:4-hydroxy-tetrahydrodipicolinate synthase
MNKLKGIFAASITPLDQDFRPDLDAVQEYLGFLANRGCHGALLLGTTGEGPSFSYSQRIDIFRSANKVREKFPDFKLLAGTSTPSLEETISITRAAFDSGMDGTVVLPPYYYHNIDEAGLLTWFTQVINQSVPDDGIFLVYHIPAITGIPLSTDFLARLLDKNPRKFSGLKDSSGDRTYAEQLGTRFGDELSVFTGNDRLLTDALSNQASGCITAMANIISPDLRSLWEAIELNHPSEPIQYRINKFRENCEQYQPFPPLIKYLLSKFHNFPHWPVCPPLTNLSGELANQISTLIN